MLYEHRVDGLQVELGCEIHDRKIFIVEIAMLFRRVTVSFDKVGEQIHMGVDMAIDIHRHEAGELQE